MSTKSAVAIAAAVLIAVVAFEGGQSQKQPAPTGANAASPATAAAFDAQRQEGERQRLAEAQHRLLETQAAEAAGAFESARRSVDQGHERIDQMTGALAAAQNDHDALASRARLYMTSHPEAVAAIMAGVVGTTAAVSGDSELSDGARAAGAVAAVIAAVYAATHAEEVAGVVETLAKADAALKQYQAEATRLTSAIEQERVALAPAEQRAQQLSERVAALRDQLIAL